MEAPERKKLKSTYRPSAALTAPLPPGWSEHTAPTGHKYFYNAQTKQSTYTRPAPPSPEPVQQQQHPLPGGFQPPNSAPFGAPQQDYAAIAQSYRNGGPNNNYAQPFPSRQQQPFNQDLSRQPHHQSQYQRRPTPEDRPKKKAVIPACAPWILIYTKLGRRFVHNTETQESLWKFPQDVMKAVIEFDRLELDKKLAARDEGTGANNVPVRENGARNRGGRRSESLQREDEAALAAELENARDVVPAAAASKTTVAGREKQAEKEDGEGEDGDDSSEYEEIEVTDDEDAENDDNNGDSNEDQPPADDNAPVEFGEDDIAYQLAQMNEEYGLEPGEYDDGALSPSAYEPGTEGLDLTHEDSTALFHDLLASHHISPYTPWETLLTNTSLIEDFRWTALPSTRLRKDAHDAWVRSTTAALKLARATTRKPDPKPAYLAFLAEKATPKLYWPEFKRKFKREDVMADVSNTKFGDKEREKLYREYIARLKMPAATLKADLLALLKSLPVKILNRATRLDKLPELLRSDIRFFSLPAKTRDGLLEAYISTLPDPVDGDDDDDEDEEARVEREKKNKERQRREEALRERERRVAEDKRRRERDVRIGRERLREGEREVEAAMRVGREGLIGQIGRGREDGGGSKQDGGDAAAAGGAGDEGAAAAAADGGLAKSPSS